jgi:ribose 5-phosphate isomerase
MPDILDQMPLPIAIIRYSGLKLFKEEPKTKQHPMWDSEVYSANAMETDE